MPETLPKPAGMPAAEWEAMCADVLRVPAMYRYAKNAYGVFARARSTGHDAEARRILNALLEYLDALGKFVSDVSAGLMQGVRENKIPAPALSGWLDDVNREVREFSAAMGNGRGLGEGITLLVVGAVAAVLAVFSLAWSAFYNWRKLNERRAELDAALASYTSLGVPLPPDVVGPPSNPWVRVDGGAALSGGVLVGLGVVVYLLSKRGR